MVRFALAACLLSLALAGSTGCDFGCEDVPSEVFDPELVALNEGQQTGNILAIGDSILEWNAEQSRSVPDVIGNRLGRTVENRAVSGARFDQPIACAAEEGLEVPRQYYSGGWDWIVITGGGNDANDGCECGDTCGALIDDLIGPEGLDGQIPRFAEALNDAGAKVMWVGYYPMPDDASFGFERCNEELEVFNERLMRLAQAHPDIWFVDAGEAIQPEDRTYYDDDRVHPSLEGAELVGRLVANAIEAAEAEAN